MNAYTAGYIIKLMGKLLSNIINGLGYICWYWFWLGLIPGFIFVYLYKKSYDSKNKKIYLKWVTFCFFSFTLIVLEYIIAYSAILLEHKFGYRLNLDPLVRHYLFEVNWYFTLIFFLYSFPDYLFIFVYTYLNFQLCILILPTEKLSFGKIEKTITMPKQINYCVIRALQIF